MSFDVPLIRRHRWLPWAALGAVLVTGSVLWLFEPQALFIDDEVSEAAPVSGGAPGSEGLEGDGMARGVLSRTTFQGLGHDARGTALVIEADDGNTYVRFEDFEVENGPDLKVYLSRAGADASEAELVREFIDLGPLKGNIGDQNYLVPSSVDLDGHRSVVVWCERFSVGFAVAPIDVMSS